ncbi:hypothetical protein B0J12DRAFT_639881 [Macrophomina phaseolina]|uniref:Uncharacterized protein n=1 Tax=Macrophomina phaseolina TaxID=35725 RepID=A0ABQ8GVQ1_9PEZI|nr:hypothetical protein B0J12DRAFT_639881 [Macrophomina phaseolina]
MFFIMLQLLIFVLSAAAVDQPRCYWPDGSLDTTGYVCNVTAAENGGASPCCLHNDACYESGSCFQDWSGVTYRQSCTDPTWRDPSCPSMCLIQGKLADSVWIQQCNLSNGTACCVDGEPCCGNSSNFFEWKPGYITAVINGDGSNRLGPYIAADANGSSSTSTSSSSSLASASTSAASRPSSESAQGSDFVPSSQPTPPVDNSKTHRNAAIAVGATFGALSLVALVGMLVLWRKYKAERRMRLAAEEKSAGQYYGQQYYSFQQQPAPAAVATELSATEGAMNELPGK